MQVNTQYAEPKLGYWARRRKNKNQDEAASGGK